MTKKRKKNKNKSLLLILVLLILICLFIYKYHITKKESNKSNSTKELVMALYEGKNISELEEFAKSNNLLLDKDYKYSNNIEENIIISQNIKEGTKLTNNSTIKVVISKGQIPVETLKENKVNELGNVPIMMYHGIHNIKSSETGNTGGNVDKDGYNRTSEAFRQDLEFYYKNNYRMIRLTDYVDGNIDVELGRSPIILTFDDGKENNFKVLEEKNGELVIDPNCAVGILEEFKKKYPDFNVTATFFVNASIFQQEEYNEKILKWLVTNGYDVGNHTMTHPDFTKIDTSTTQQEVGGVYKILDSIIPKKYVNIIAMPFGSPYKSTHPNFKYMVEANYEGKVYKTKSLLRVGWEGEESPFSKNFDPLFLKRIRAYDNNGVDFDIEMNFKILNNTRYISDGDANTVVVPEKYKDNLNTTKQVRTY